jgi:NTP pyrophosphatase (non-canonical NTP hydrolase)
MKNNLELVAKWMKTFKQPVSQGFTDKKHLLLGMKLIIEEAYELMAEVHKMTNDEGDKDHFVKELGDLLWVVYWMSAHVGVDVDSVMFELYKSNMSKLDDNGQPIFREDGKILKGSHYEEPKLDNIVDRIPISFA